MTLQQLEYIVALDNQTKTKYLLLIDRIKTD
jgi:hypothetical protein